MINDYNPRRKPDFFIDGDPNSLLVTIGDSNTWGQGLGRCTQDHDDIESRKAQCYGRTMSNRLNSSWLNLGFSGCGNGYVLKCLDDLISGQHLSWLNQASYDDIRDPSWPMKLEEVRNGPHTDILEELRSVYCQSTNPYTELIKQYQNVYIVVQLTEGGRDASRYDWMLEGQTRVADYLMLEERYNFSWLNQIIDDCEHTIIVGRHANVEFDEESKDISRCLPKTWAQVNWDHDGDDHPDIDSNAALSLTGPYTAVVYQLGLLAGISDYKQWMLEQSEVIEPLWKYAQDSNLYCNESTWHPSRESHVLWANYLLDHL
jgi:hypothetical protein